MDQRWMEKLDKLAEACVSKFPSTQVENGKVVTYRHGRRKGQPKDFFDVDHVGFSKLITHARAYLYGACYRSIFVVDEEVINDLRLGIWKLLRDYGATPDDRAFHEAFKLRILNFLSNEKKKRGKPRWAADHFFSELPEHLGTSTFEDRVIAEDLLHAIYEKADDSLKELITCRLKGIDTKKEQARVLGWSQGKLSRRWQKLSSLAATVAAEGTS